MAFTTLPSTSKAAMRAAREWQRVPEALTDDEVLAQGLIPPEVLELVMQIVMDVIMNCLDNNRSIAWRRVQNYRSAKRENRIGDNLRLNLLVNLWMTRLGYPRESGDVVHLRESIVKMVDGSDETEFEKVQTEIMWMGI